MTVRYEKDARGRSTAVENVESAAPVDPSRGWPSQNEDVVAGAAIHAERARAGVDEVVARTTIERNCRSATDQYVGVSCPDQAFKAAQRIETGSARVLLCSDT